MESLERLITTFRSERLILRSNVTKSPTSDTAHNPKFDNVNVSSPAPDEIEAPAEVWELDTALLPQERLEISKHRSEYECSRAYNMIQNKKALDQLDLPSSVNHLFSAG